MLVARASKRSASEMLGTDSRCDILDGERVLGRLSADRQTLGATMTLEGQTFVVEHIRGSKANGHRQPDRYQLKEATGRDLAVAEQTGEVFQITRGQERFRFAKGRSRLLFNLWAEGQPTPLGAVGQTKFWTLNMHMNLPDALGAPFQVFLLALLLGLIAQRAGNLPDL